MLSFDIEANRMKFIANRILPILSVENASGKFGKIPLKSLLKRADVRRGPKGEYNRIDWDFTDAGYSTKEYGLEGVVDARNAKMYANYFDAEAATAKLVLHQVLLEAEIRVRDMLTPVTSSYTATANIGAWSNPASSQPVDDVDLAVLRIFAATGIWPNAIVMNKAVFRNIRKSEQVLEKIAAMGAGDKIKARDVTTAMLAACFDLDHVIVSEAVYNTADEGLTATPGHIWSSSYAYVGRIAETQDISEPCLGHTMHWAGDGSEPGGLVESYWHEPARADVERVRHDVDENIKYTEMWDVIGLT